MEYYLPFFFTILCGDDLLHSLRLFSLLCGPGLQSGPPWLQTLTFYKYSYQHTKSVLHFINDLLYILKPCTHQAMRSKIKGLMSPITCSLVVLSFKNPWHASTVSAAELKCWLMGWAAYGVLSSCSFVPRFPFNLSCPSVWLCILFAVLHKMWHVFFSLRVLALHLSTKASEMSNNFGTNSWAVWPAD